MSQRGKNKKSEVEEETINNVLMALYSVDGQE
jgi:hypothetical protein